jgi:deoxyribodipyrimidine photo-lyase
MLPPAVIVWHRRDLRLHDNTALHHALQYSSRILPLFILDPGILSRSDTAPGRVQFLLESLQVLQKRYQAIGGQLVIEQGDPVVVLPLLAAKVQARWVVWNEDYEPYALQRDTQVQQALAAQGIIVKSYPDQLLHSPGEILTQNKEFYSVYTPFWRNWIRSKKKDPWPTPTRLDPIENLSSLALPSLRDLGFESDQELPAAGEEVALDLLAEFSAHAIWNYAEQRNFPAISGTSQLSPHLRWGTLGIRQVWQTTVDLEPDIRSDEAAGSLEVWRQELAWREFYKHVLVAWPYVETGSYRPVFDRLEWGNRSDYFAAWCQGQTGYPIVDAAMRQLNQTGWMHNRCRMIVASFLTKDLLIDWRWGELYFMQKLVDGDLAANNGGWQWSAGVGTDPKPLRIFNPSTQAARFDPEGDYIRHYVPELSGLDTYALLTVGQSKIGMQALQNRIQMGYPRPIVDHNKQQALFKQRYQACR